MSALCLLEKAALFPWVKHQVIALGIALHGDNLCRFYFCKENAYRATLVLRLTLDHPGSLLGEVEAPE